ncbi:MAG: sugar phosphate isomerase/epimerase [Chloroflexi bacterium]|nr:sugar phosphate isomerase/epimerase [Chloroflexota bacterium]
MTNPREELIPQLVWLGEQGFDFADLAIEPPKADASDVAPAPVRQALDRYGLGVVVHTSPYLPYDNPSRKIQDAALAELLRALQLAADLRAPLLTVHYLGAPPFFSHDDTVLWYAGLLTALCNSAAGAGVAVALENSPENKDQLKILRDLFRRVPALRLLLDVGHAHIGIARNLTEEYLWDADLSPRLAHIHMSDNDGKGDLHAPLGGARNGVDWPKIVGSLRKRNYDGTITLEVFSPDRDYLLMSRDKLKAWWTAAERRP